MDELTEAELHALTRAIALREGNARELSERFNIPVAKLKAYAAANRDVLEAIKRAEEREVSVESLDSLWITKKVERLARYQAVADQLYDNIRHTPGVSDSTELREFRSYLAAVANELGQLLHRGAGESGSDTLNVDIEGVDLDMMR